MDPFHTEINNITESIDECYKLIDDIKEDYKNKEIIFPLKINDSDTASIYNAIDWLKYELDKFRNTINSRGKAIQDINWCGTK